MCQKNKRHVGTLPQQIDDSIRTCTVNCAGKLGESTGASMQLLTRHPGAQNNGTKTYAEDSAAWTMGATVMITAFY
ncbi:hypothetical protein VTJ49DRAFT_2421 [Mycothermus thermophilus]|uniref:Uncharacterized protein n=1 Tax=Humicola insolens TaxID=85995 RepID=A0ABR3VAB6_HUMIN